MYSDIQPLARELMEIFNQRFGSGEEPTHLEPSAGEPEFLPGDGVSVPSQILFAHGFASSALHEVAHWCIAGKKRRQLIDYGYWYKPDGRSQIEQEKFFEVEAKPQALEWIFSIAVDVRFHISCDNLNGARGDTDRMRDMVAQQARLYLQKGFPKRAGKFLNDLMVYFQSKTIFEKQSKLISNCRLLPD